MKTYWITYWEDSYAWSNGGTMHNTTSTIHPLIWLKREQKKAQKHAEKWLNPTHELTLMSWVELTEKEIKLIEKEK